MSLTDLKKKTNKTKKVKSVNIDDFIDDATAYAKGQSILSKKKQKPGRNRNYKNATFTLTPEHITQLNHLAEETGFAKSRILRLLIERLSHESDISDSALKEILNTEKNENK